MIEFGIVGQKYMFMKIKTDFKKNYLIRKHFNLKEKK